MKTRRIQSLRPLERHQRQAGSILVVVVVVLLLIGALLAGVTQRTTHLRAELRRIEDRQIQHWATNGMVATEKPASHTTSTGNGPR